MKDIFSSLTPFNITSDQEKIAKEILDPIFQ
jgi:hypothetical protein